jgi:hypothetical protein
MIPVSSKNLPLPEWPSGYSPHRGDKCTGNPFLNLVLSPSFVLADLFFVRRYRIGKKIFVLEVQGLPKSGQLSVNV